MEYRIYSFSRLFDLLEGRVAGFPGVLHGLPVALHAVAALAARERELVRVCEAATRVRGHGHRLGHQKDFLGRGGERREEKTGDIWWKCYSIIRQY